MTNVSTVVSITDFLTPAVREMPPSGIRKFFEYSTGRKDIVSLGVGEPDFVTPQHVRKYVSQHWKMAKHHTHQMPVFLSFVRRLPGIWRATSTHPTTRQMKSWLPLAAVKP